MYSGLGMNFGHHSDNWAEPGLTFSLTEIYNAGIRHIRTNSIDYKDETEDPSYVAKIRLQVTTWLAMGSDTTAIIGYSLPEGESADQTKIEGVYTDNIELLATWVATQSADYQSRITIEVANEDDHDVTWTAATYRAYMRDTLAASVQSIAPLSKVSIAIRNDSIGAWISGGRGSFTHIAENLYKNEATFNTHVLNLVTAFGPDHCYISEFGYIDESEGYSFYDGDDEQAGREAWRQMDQCRKYGIRCYFFIYDTFPLGNFALRSTIGAAGTLRRPWYTMTAKREQYIQVTTPR